MTRPSIIIRRKINSLARRRGWTWAPARPIKAWISPTTVCNLNCRTCGRKISDVTIGHLRPETYAIIRRDLLPGLGHVILTGVGEPLLAPLLPEMIDDCRRRAIRIEMTTNGTIWKEEVFKPLSKMTARVIVSVDGARRETLEAIRCGIPFDAFRKNVERVAQLKRRAGNADFELFFNVVLLKDNLSEINEIVRWGAELGVNCIYFSHFNAEGHTDEFADQTVENHPERVAPVLAEATALCDSHGIKYLCPLNRESGGGGAPAAPPPSVESCRLGQCALPWWAVYIEADGSVLPCCQWWPPIANLHDTPFGRIWNGPVYRSIRRTVNRRPLPGPCQKCILGERVF